MTNEEAWASFMVGLVVAYRRPQADQHALATHLTNLVPMAGPTFKTMGASKALVLQLIQNIDKGQAKGKSDGMPGFQYATRLVTLKNQMKPALAGFYVHPNVPENLARVVRIAVALLAPDTGTVDKRDGALNKALNAIPDRVIRLMFNRPTEALNDQQQLMAESRKLVKKMVGRDDVRLAPTETKKAKIDHPDAYKRYNQVKSAIATCYQDHIRNAAREAGKPIKIGTAIRDMKKAGITYHPYTGLENLHVGEEGKLYTAAPHRLITKMPAPGSKIMMNPLYDPKTNNTYVFKFQVPGSKRAADEFSAAYTHDYNVVRKNKRFDLVTNAAKKMPTFRARWLKDIKNRDLTTQRLAAMVEILYSQAMRIGGTKNAVDGKATYGLSTLLVNHITMRNGTAILSYPGKDAIQQKHVIKADADALPETAAVLKILAAAIKGKRGTDRVWTDGNGNPISSSDVNAYIRGKNIPISAHKFRHIAGSAKMAEVLAHMKIPTNATQQQVEKLVKTAALQVGELLGHVSGDKVTSATSIKSYISPGLLANFFKEKGLRIPQWVPSSGRGSSSKDDD